MSEQNQTDAQRVCFVVVFSCFCRHPLGVKLEDAAVLPELQPVCRRYSCCVFFFWPSRLNVAVRAVGCGLVPLFFKSGRSRWSFEMFPNQEKLQQKWKPF